MKPKKSRVKWMKMSAIKLVIQLSAVSPYACKTNSHAGPGE